MADTNALNGALLLLLRRDKPEVKSDLQAFGTSRNTFFTGSNDTLYKHVCPPPFEGGPFDPVPDVPDRELRLTLMDRFDLDLNPYPNVAAMVGDDELPMWIIEDRLGDVRESYPSPLLRVVQGDVIHAQVGSSTGTHTIHWHGIEPTPMNDGVGKHSFEINGDFIYQFQPNEAGTYFYHCHKNTVLHFEMGLYGALIVDPPAPPGAAGLTAPYVTGGPGFVAGRLPNSPAGTELLRYDMEKIWVADSIDSTWHLQDGSEPHHAHNMQVCNVDDPAAPITFHEFGSTEFDLNIYHPNIFAVTGVLMDEGVPNAQGVYEGFIDDPAIRIDALIGQTVLLRYINAGYTLQELILPVDATVIAWDGHPLGVGGFHEFSFPYVVPAGRPIRTSTARRMDIILNTSAPVSSLAHIRYYDWIKRVPSGLVGHVQIPVVIA